MQVPEMTMDTAHFLGATCALVSGLAWALGAVLFKNLGETVAPVLLTFYKGMVSIPLLFIAVLFVSPGEFSLNATLWLCLSGFLGTTLGDTFFFAALRRLTPVMLLVFLVLGQVFTAFLTVRILQEDIPPLVWLGLFAVISGVVIVLYAPSHSSDAGISQRSRFEGICYAALTTVTISLSFIVMKPALAEINALHATFIRMSAAILFLVPYILIVPSLRRGLVAAANDTSFLSRLVRATVVVTFGGFYLSVAAFKYTTVPVASALSATEPVFALPLSWLLLRMRVNKREIVGAILCVLGIITVFLGH